MKQVYEAFTKKRLSDEPGYKISAIVAAFLIALGVLSSYFLSNAITSQQNTVRDSASQQQLTYIASYIRSRLVAYDNSTIASSAVFSDRSPQDVSISKWQDYIKKLKITERSAEVMRLGYADYNYNDGYPTSKITKLYPDSDDNNAAYKFDMTSETNRRTAITEAIETGQPAQTPPIVAVQDSNRADGRKPSSVIVYYPVYDPALPINTKSERQNATIGLSYLIFRVEDMMKNIEAGLNNKTTGFSLDTLIEGQQQTLYNFGKTDDKIHSKTLNITFAHNQWNINVYPQVSVVDRFYSPIMLFIGGSVFSLFLGLSSFVMLMRKNRQLAQDHEQQIQQTKDELLALASHQLRTPASSVRQYIAMVKEGYFGELNHKQQEVVDKAFDANNRQLEIIDQLLYVAKADAGQLMLEKIEFDLVDLVNKIIDGFKDAADKKKLRLKSVLPKKLIIKGDPRYISMAVENLVSNAIKYSHSDKLVTVKLSRNRNEADISVIDEGVGIEEEDFNKLFNKFSRINNPLSRSEGGTGLGLFLARKITEAHGGKITVKSRPNVGSTFTLTMPTHDNHISVVQLTK